MRLLLETLSAKPKLSDEDAVTRLIFSLEIIEKASSLAHDLEQAATRMMILRVCLEMFLESRDSLGQERDLNFGRSGIGFAPLMGSNDFRFFLCRDQLV